MARLYKYCLSHNASLAWCSGNRLWWRCDTYSVKLTHVDSQSQLSLYSHCCPLLYPSQPAGSISSCPQLTLTKVTHFVDPRSGSPVTLGHPAPDNNMCDVISNGISDSRNLPKYIIIVPDKDILEGMNIPPFGAKPIIHNALKWLVTQIFRLLESRREDLQSKWLGAVAADPTQVIWVKMFPRLVSVNESLVKTLKLHRKIQWNSGRDFVPWSE